MSVLNNTARTAAAAVIASMVAALPVAAATAPAAATSVASTPAALGAAAAPVAEAATGWLGFTPDLALCVAGLSLVCIVIRVLPMTLLAGRELPRVVVHWLAFVPVAVLSALLIPDLVLQKGELFLSPHNVFLVAAVPTLIVIWRTGGSFFGAMATGMGVVAACRYLWPDFF